MNKKHQSTTNGKTNKNYREKLIPSDDNLEKLEKSFGKVREKVINKTKNNDHIEFVETGKK